MLCIRIPYPMCKTHKTWCGIFVHISSTWVTLCLTGYKEKVISCLSFSLFLKTTSFTYSAPNGPWVGSCCLRLCLLVSPPKSFVKRSLNITRFLAASWEEWMEEFGTNLLVWGPRENRGNTTNISYTVTWFLVKLMHFGTQLLSLFSAPPERKLQMFYLLLIFTIKLLIHMNKVIHNNKLSNLKIQITTRAQICNLYPKLTKSLPLIPAGSHTGWFLVNILIKPVGNCWEDGRSALKYSLYHAAYLLPDWLNKTPGICGFLSQQKTAFKDILASHLKAANSSILNSVFF